MKIYRKFLIFMIVGALCTMNLVSFEMGLVGGIQSNPSEKNYGLSGGWGFILPKVKFEVEFIKTAGTEFKSLTGGVKFRPKIGSFSLYAILGVGTEFDEFHFNLSRNNNFTFIGAGAHYHFLEVFSMRLDIRLLNFSDFNRTRVSAGLFFHL